MKVKSLLLTALFTLTLSSFVPTGESRLELGRKAPEILLVDEFNEPSQLEFKEKHTILNFWSASDPLSRMRNRNLNNFVSENGSLYDFISICIDKDPLIQNEIMRTDGIKDAGTYISSSQLYKDILKDYQTGKGLRCFLIDQNGILQAASTSIEDLHLPQTLLN